MQAQNSSEGKKSKKDGQYPAPPARSEASGLGIAKELVDFLLEHVVKPVAAREPSLMRILYREPLLVYIWCPVRLDYT